MKHIQFLLLFLLLSVITLSAQEEKVQDVVYLLDGSVLVGTIMEYKKGEEVVFRLKNGETLKIKDNEVDRMVQKVPEKSYLSPLKPPFEKGKLYHAVLLSVNAGTTFMEDGDWGIGVEAINGYNINDDISIGLGTGLQQYSTSVAWRVVPVFLDIQFKSNHRSPWLVNGDVGIGFPMKSDRHNIQETEVGERFRFGIGKVFNMRSSAHIFTDFGYQYQRSKLVSNGWGWSSEDEVIRNIKFKRWQFRFGLVF